MFGVLREVECVQLSPAWWEARRGVVTASAADRILTPTGKASSAQDGYIAELIGDLVSQNPTAFTETGRIGTPAMEAGRAAEPESRRWYEFTYRCTVREVGFLVTEDGRCGLSPDGLVTEEGLVELKNPLPKTHAAWLMKGGLPADYKPQVHFQLALTGRKWNDFTSYCPGLKPLVVRVEPDDYTKLLAAELERFLVKLEAAKLRLLGTPPAAMRRGAVTT